MSGALAQWRKRAIDFTMAGVMLGGGVGSELRHPLGLTMFGGLIVSQLLTLYTTPVIYLAFDRLAQRLRARKTATAGVTTENEPP